MWGPQLGSAFPVTHPVSDNPNSIVCNVLGIGGGWRVEVLMPSTVSADDAQKMFRWLDSYRCEIRRQHPYWLLSLRITDRAYTLDIEPAEDSREFIAKAIPFLQSQLQLDFDHA